jgi:hypothetical protein
MASVGRQIFRDRFVCIAWRDHPLAKKKTLSMPAFTAAAHELVSPWGTEGGHEMTRSPALASNGKSPSPSALLGRTAHHRFEQPPAHHG